MPDSHLCDHRDTAHFPLLDYLVGVVVSAVPAYLPRHAACGCNSAANGHQSEKAGRRGEVKIKSLPLL